MFLPSSRNEHHDQWFSLNSFTVYIYRMLTYDGQLVIFVWLTMKFREFPHRFLPAVPNDPLVPTAVLGENYGMVGYVPFTTSSLYWSPIIIPKPLCLQPCLCYPCASLSRSTFCVRRSHCVLRCDGLWLQWVVGSFGTKDCLFSACYKC